MNRKILRASIFLLFGLVSVGILVHGYRSAPVASNVPQLPTQEAIEGARRRLKIARNLVHSHKARKLFRCTVVDGVRSIKGACSQAKFTPLYAFVNKDRRRGEEEECLRLLRDKCGEDFLVMTVGETYMNLLRKSPHPPSIVVVAAVPQWDPSEVMSVRGNAKILIMDSMNDPVNVGALARSALAFDFTRVVVLDTVDPFSPKAVREASGYSFGLPINALAHKDAARLVERIVNQGGSVKLAAPNRPKGWSVVPRRDVTWDPPYALIVGSEGHGVTDLFMKELNDSKLLHSLERLNRQRDHQLWDAANMEENITSEIEETEETLEDTPYHCVTLETAPSVESLNVAVAAGLLMGDAFAYGQGKM